MLPVLPIGHILRQWRDALRLTQSEAAVLFGCSRRSWQQVEAASNITINTLFDICRLTGMDPDFLLGHCKGPVIFDEMDQTAIVCFSELWNPHLIALVDHAVLVCFDIASDDDAICNYRHYAGVHPLSNFQAACKMIQRKAPTVPRVSDLHQLRIRGISPNVAILGNDIAAGIALIRKYARPHDNYTKNALLAAATPPKHRELIELVIFSTHEFQRKLTD